MSSSDALRLTALATLPEIRPGDDLAGLIAEASQREGFAWREGMVLVVAQKIISKAEGAVVDLRTITPSPRALSFAEEHDKDPRLVELVLNQSKRIVRMERGLIIAETLHGFVCANAGVDRSNVPGDDYATVLPTDPDRSAATLRKGLCESLGIDLAVVISDTFGRPWRRGQVNVALGVAGFNPLEDARGKSDRQGRPLVATEPATADEIAAAAGLLMAKDVGRPVVLVEGLQLEPAEGNARELIRESEQDLFR